MIEFRNLSADEAEKIIDDLQSQKNRGGSRSGTSGRRSAPRRSSGGGRRPHVMGALTTDALPNGTRDDLLVIRPAAWVEPYIATTPISPLITLLLTESAADGEQEDEQPAGAAAQRRALERAVLDELENRGKQEPAEATESKRETEEPSAEPPRSIVDTLSGVSGELRGEVTAKGRR